MRRAFEVCIVIRYFWIQGDRCQPTARGVKLIAEPRGRVAKARARVLQDQNMQIIVRGEKVLATTGSPHHASS
jgi:hypothetical protein